jgi:hypothetical protein
VPLQRTLDRFCVSDIAVGSPAKRDERQATNRTGADKSRS